MKIAQIAPLAESCPPRLYGGTERIVSYLTEELVRQGHEVTLFASGDSITSAKLVPCSRMALRLDPTVRDPTPYHIMMLDQVAKRANEFDVLHFHIDHLHYPLMRPYADRILTTLHGRLDLPDLMPFYNAFPEFPLISISNAQRRPMPPVNWLRTVLHGLPRNLLPFQPSSGDYFAFLGRISPEKGPEAAKAVGTLPRRLIRERFERRFTAERMARDYLAAYSRLPAIQNPISPINLSAIRTNRHAISLRGLPAQSGDGPE